VACDELTEPAVLPGCRPADHLRFAEVTDDPDPLTVVLGAVPRAPKLAPRLQLRNILQQQGGVSIDLAVAQTSPLWCP